MATPLTVVALEAAGSTQDEARSRFSGAAVLVVAASQTAGRGRRGVFWETAPRALAASLAWDPKWPLESSPRLALVAGLAALDALDPGCTLKWPNDVIADGAKVGGILAEGFDDVVVIGLGVNLFWPEPPPGCGALAHEDPGPDAAPPLARRWGERLLERAAAGPESWGHDEYVLRCSTIGERITWEPGGEGIAVGVAPGGGLVVRTAAGETVLESGVVHTIRRADEAPLDSTA